MTLFKNDTYIFDDWSCFTTHLCDVMLVQEHNKEDNLTSTPFTRESLLAL